MAFQIENRPRMTRLQTRAFRAILCVGACFAVPTCARAQVSHVDDLIARLCSPDGTISRQASQELLAARDELAPVFFDRYVSADWSIKPRLLERLVGTTHAIVRTKLLHGTDSERIHAALLCAYSKLSSCREAAVAPLLGAMKSDDKHLRAVASYALVYDDENGVVFDHFHEIVPVLISSFGTPIILDLHGNSPGNSLIFGIGTALDALIGDRLAFLEMQSKLRRVNSTDEGGSPRAAQEYTERLLAANQDQFDNLRSYWETWWKTHSTRTTTELGILIIERNIAILGAKRVEGTHTFTAALAEGSLQAWTGQDTVEGHEGWNAWWKEARRSYDGPPRQRD